VSAGQSIKKRITKISYEIRKDYECHFYFIEFNVVAKIKIPLVQRIEPRSYHISIIGIHATIQISHVRLQ